MGAGAIAGIILGLIAAGAAVYFGVKYGQSKNSTAAATTAAAVAATTSATLTPVSTTSGTATATAPVAIPIAAPAAVAQSVTVSNPSGSTTPTVTFWSGTGGTGTSATVSTPAQMMSMSIPNPLSATVANGGSFSYTIGFSDGTSVSWVVPATQIGPVNTPAALLALTTGGSQKTATSGSFTVNGQTKTMSAPTPPPAASTATGGKLAPATSTPSTGTASFFAGANGTGAMTTVTTAQQLLDSGLGPVSAFVSGGGNFSILGASSSGQTASFTIPPGQVGVVNAPAPFAAAIAAKSFSSISVSINGTTVST